MEPRRLSLMPVLLALCGAVSCAALDFEPLPPVQAPPQPVADHTQAPGPAVPAAGSGPAVVAQASPPSAPVQPPAPRPVQPMHLTGGDMSDVRVGPQAPAITETLDRTLNMLAEARLENEKLKEQLAAAQKVLAAREAETEEMTAQLAQAGARVHEFEEAMEKWKKDVLGFRDEMRAYEEAEIEVLREVAVLLRGFKREADAQAGEGSTP